MSPFYCLKDQRAEESGIWIGTIIKRLFIGETQIAVPRCVQLNSFPISISSAVAQRRDLWTKLVKVQIMFWYHQAGLIPIEYRGRSIIKRYDGKSPAAVSLHVVPALKKERTTAPLYRNCNLYNAPSSSSSSTVEGECMRRRRRRYQRGR